MADRAILFIDGNNWFHALKDARVRGLFELDYAKISEKLIGPREWVGTRYYIGRVPQNLNPQHYADQRSFVSRLEKTDERVSVHFGRLEPRPFSNPLSRELLDYLYSLEVRIDRDVFQELVRIAGNNQNSVVHVEKAVDVMLAVDMVRMAVEDEYDAAYLLSADGDFTPAVEHVMSLGKKVYAATPASGMELGKVVQSFIRMDSDWFFGCYS